MSPDRQKRYDESRKRFEVTESGTWVTHTPKTQTPGVRSGQLLTDGGTDVRDRWTIRHEPVLAEMVNEAVDRYGYMDTSEFVREAVRTHLRRVTANEAWGRKPSLNGNGNGGR